MKMLRTIFSLSALTLGLHAQAQYTFGPEVQTTPSASITYNSGTGAFQYTDAANSTTDDAAIPLTGSAASIITTSSAWTGTLAVNLTAKTIGVGKVNLHLILSSGSNTVLISVAQHNYTGKTGSQSVPDDFYGTSTQFIAANSNGNVTTTPLGNSLTYNGVSYLAFPGSGTAVTATTESLAAASGTIALSYNVATNTVTGYYNGTPIGNFVLTSWGSNPPLTLSVQGESKAVTVAAGDATAANFYAGLGAPTDVSFYGIQKASYYVQSSASAPTLHPTTAYRFFTNVNPGTSGALFTNGTLTPPADSTGTVAYSTVANGLSFTEDFTNKSALDAAFSSGSGIYNLTLQTTTPNNYSDQMSFGSEGYPAIPQITNVTNATWSGGNLVVTDITKPVTFTWNNPTGAYADFQVSNTSIESNGTTTTSYTVPANSLSNNTLYKADVFLINDTGTDSKTISGASGGASFSTQVSFFLQTGTPSTPTSLYVIAKSHVLVQSSNSAPVDGSGNSDLFADPAPYNLAVGSPVSGTVTGPSSTSIPLGFSVGGDSVFPGPYKYASGPVSSLSALNSAYPDGTYTLPSGAQVNLTGDSYPAAPQITLVNSAAPVWDAQGHLVLNPTIANTITWSSVTVPNFTTNGYENAYVESASDFSSVNMKAGVFASGSSAFTTLTIPANTMTPGITYFGEIAYFAIPSISNPSANVYDAAIYRTGTEFEVAPTYSSGLLQAITFPDPANQTYGVAPFTLNATASSGLAVSYSVVSGPATLSGTNNSTVTITGGGTVVIQASQAGNGTYAAAANVQQSFTVGPASQTITFPGFGASQQSEPVGTSVTLGATASSGLAVTYQITTGAGLANLSGASNNILTFTGDGTVTVEADQTGNTNYSAASPVTQTFTVVGYTFGAQVQSTSSASITYNPATSVFQYTDAANSTDDDAYLPLTGSAATFITTSTGWTASITVNLSARSMTSTNTPGAGTPDAAMGLFILDNNSLSNHVGIPLVQENNAGHSSSSDIPADFYGTAVDFTAQANGNPVATTPLGSSQNITGGASYQVLSGGTSNSYATESISAATGVVTLSYNASTNTVTGYYNGNPVGSYSLASWGSSPSLTLAVTGYSGEGVAVPTGTDTGSDFYAGPPLTQTIIFPAIANQQYSSSQFTLNPPLNATATSGLPVSYTYVSGPATLSGPNNDVATITGIGTVVIQARQAGNGSYLAATNVNQSFTVAAPQDFIHWENQHGFLQVLPSPSATTQHDGIPILLKYLANINPAQPMAAADWAALPVAGTTTIAAPDAPIAPALASASLTTSGTTYLTLTYRQYAYLDAGAATIAVQTSPDLQTWTTLSNPTIVPMGTDSNTGDPIMQVQVPMSGTKQFIRLNVTSP